MEDLTIPGWALYTGSGVLGLIILWLRYLTLKSNDNATQIAVNITEAENLSKQLSSINESITSARTEFKESITGVRVEFKVSFDKLELKFDTFMADELKFFKDKYNRE